MRIVFTLCSNNYLAHAKTLGDSLLVTNPDVKFVIGLIDEISSEIDYSFFGSFEVLPYDKIGVEFFDEMIAKYNIIEFNTAVKPFYFEYFFSHYGEDSLVYYLDPDIVCFSSLQPTYDLFSNHDILITPHITKASDSITAFETLILNVGIYNLGFIGVRYSKNTMDFLKWWQLRVRDHCLIDLPNGLFVDQLWINFVPILFEKVCILRFPGCNMACWNFYERTLIKRENTYYVNDFQSPLIFFHFSGFNPNNLKYVGKMRTKEFEMSARKDLVNIFSDYNASLRRNRYESLSNVKPLLKFKSMGAVKIKYTLWQRIGNYLKYKINIMLKAVFKI